MSGALAAATGAATGAGLPTAGATVLRRGTNVLVSLPAAGLVARVVPAARRATAEREVAVGRALARCEVPAVRLADVGCEQPLDAGESVVSLWDHAEHDPRLVATPDQLGQLARRLHEVTAGGLPGVPPLDPLAAVAAQVAGLGVPVLEGEAATLRRAWERWGPIDPAGPALVHGDLHKGNVLVGPAGPLLVDFEMAGVGPPAYDLVPQLVAVRRYGEAPHGLAAFTAAYGRDVTAWEGAEVLARVYELWVTAWVVAAARHDRSLRAEADARLAYWRGDPDPPRWTLR